MTIEEIKKLKLELEKEIMELLSNFQDQSGLTVEDISITQERFVFSPPVIINVSIKCTL